MKIFLSLILSLAFGLASFRLRWLTKTGSLVAVLFGWSLLQFGGMAWIAPVLVFFGTASVLSKIHRSSDTALNSDLHKAAEDIRNGGQVLANGGIAWAFLLLNTLVPHPLWYMGFAGALAAATADTWGTEIGRLSQGKTHSILTGKIVPQGVSGGVSWQGTLGGIIGAGLIACIAAMYSLEPVVNLIISMKILSTIVCAGTAGSLVDSILGATLQVRYRMLSTGAISEENGSGDVDIEHFSGRRWMTNDAVNFACTATGAIVAMLFHVSGYAFHGF